MPPALQHTNTGAKTQGWRGSGTWFCPFPSSSNILEMWLATCLAIGLPKLAQSGWLWLAMTGIHFPKPYQPSLSGRATNCRNQADAPASWTSSTLSTFHSTDSAHFFYVSLVLLTSLNLGCPFWTPFLSFLFSLRPEGVRSLRSCFGCSHLDFAILLFHGYNLSLLWDGSEHLLWDSYLNPMKIIVICWLSSRTECIMVLVFAVEITIYILNLLKLISS